MIKSNFFQDRKRRLALAIAGVIVALFIGITVIYWISSSRKKDYLQTVDQAYSPYVEAYTAGIVSKQSVIRVQFASDVALLAHSADNEERSLFSISPAIEGKTYWEDERTIAFKPTKDLNPSEVYSVTFKLGSVAKVPSELKNFEFQFKVVTPAFQIAYDGLRSSNSTSTDRMTFSGVMSLSDHENPSKIEELLWAEYEGRRIRINWTHHLEDNTSQFEIDSLLKGDNPKKLLLKWNGKPINAKNTGIEELTVPPQGVFKVLDVKSIQEPEQYILVQFSNPLSPRQDLKGLITIANLNDLAYTIEGSQVKIYAPAHIEGSFQLAVNTGVEDILGLKLNPTVNFNLTVENNFPRVTIPGKGVILPSSGKLTLPFEAINLKAVDISIVKIHAQNVPQHLQVNDLDGGNELRRVARPLVVKTIRLDQDGSLDLKKKNRFALDLDKFLRTEPGAIYRVTIGFRKSYSLFKCAADGQSRDKNDDHSSNIEDEDDFWNRYDSYYSEDFEWESKDDPCSPSYYTREHWVMRNVLASNIGLIAKQGSDRSMNLIATDLLTAKPMSGVSMKVLDYQNQLLNTVVTDDDGVATLTYSRKPYLIVASKGSQRGYLRLDDGGSLPLSRFDVGGQTIQKGIKGFIYGDRGVWRPGDSIFVGFMMEKKTQKIPDDMPITFELYTPQGQLQKRMVQNNSLNGVCTFRIATATSAPTGNWQAKVKVGGAVFEKAIKVETIMPNRLKVNLDFGGKDKLLNNLQNPITLTAKWLFGALAQNLNAKVDVSLSADRTSFKQFADFYFDDPANPFQPETQNLFEGKLDGAGRVIFQANIKPATTPPGVLWSTFTTKVFEPGGNFTIDQVSLPYYMYNSYVGLRTPKKDNLMAMLPTDQNHIVDLVNCNVDGQLIAGNRQVELSFIKIQWRWWWDQGEENLSRFSQNQNYKLLSKETITLQNGRGKWNLRVNQPDWGRYLILVRDLQSGHVSGKIVYVDSPGWAQREQQNNSSEASMLSFAADKEKYKVNDIVNLTIPTSAEGRALISIENGSRVLKSWWITADKGQTKCSFKAESNMAPNVFVNVSLLQPHGQTTNDLPIRMYGAIPILIEDPKTTLKPTISMPNTLRPETTASINVSESTGKAMTYHLAMVDEGLLDLTAFKTPDPHAAFYAREALGVKTWDLFDYVLGAWGGDLERILGIGGDAAIKRNLSPAKANRFKPIVKFLGPFYIGPGQKKNHQIKLQPYVGSVRVMVIAGQDGAYGSAEKSVPVKKPLMVLATLPRMIGPNERFKLPITVFATESKFKDVQVEVQASNLFEVKNARQAIHFDKPGEKMVEADVQVKDGVGIAKVKIVVRSGSEKSEYEVEMDVRNPNPFITDVNGVELERGNNWSAEIKPVGTQGTNSAMVEVSSIPSLNLGKRLNYLVRYPHGCVEQTTSGAFAQLVLPQLTDLSPARKAIVERNVNAGVMALRKFQTPDGGLAYWPGDSESNEWGTNYAGHFLIEAQARGYSLPVGLLDSWKRFQRNKALDWSPKKDLLYWGFDLDQAYRLYLLALVKAPEIGAMNRLKEYPVLSREAKWRLAAAYQLIGQSAAANQLTQGLDYQVKPYKQLGWTFGSDLRDKAMILESLVEMGRKAEAAKLLQQVAAGLSSDEWESTQATAYGLISVAKYLGKNQSGAKMNYLYTLNGVKKVVSANATMQQMPINSNQANSFSISNQGDARLYVRVIREGQAPIGTNPPLANNPSVLVMSLIYKNLKGQIISPDRLAQGSDFVAEVTVKNTGNRGSYEQMALVQIFPAGWEIVNTRLNDQANPLVSSPYDYRDIRDDRVLTYFNLPQGKVYTFQVLLNAAYMGRYYLPTSTAEAMYDHNIQAGVPGKWIEVVPQQ